MGRRIALFGESEKGTFSTAYFCDTLSQLADTLGNPPEDSQGLHCAIQALLYHRPLMYVRVEEEGFSLDDYHHGIHLLEQDNLIAEVGAVCMPGVGNRTLVEAAGSLCQRYNHPLIISESDLYDFLTTRELVS